MNASTTLISKESRKIKISSLPCAIIERILDRMEDEKNLTFLEIHKEDVLEIPTRGENVNSLFSLNVSKATK